MIVSCARTTQIEYINWSEPLGKRSTNEQKVKLGYSVVISVLFSEFY